MYRFEVAVAPGQSEKLDVKEEQLVSESVGLVNADVNLLLLYSRSQAISPQIKAALEKVVGLRNALTDLQRQVAQVE